LPALENLSQAHFQREHEILVFLGVIIVWKNRKSSSLLYYLSTIYMYTKLANIFLFFRGNPLAGLIYFAICLGYHLTALRLIDPSNFSLLCHHP